MLLPLGVALILASPPLPPKPCPHVLQIHDGGHDAEPAVRALIQMGPPAISAVLEALSNAPDDGVAEHFLQVLVTNRDARTAAAIRPLVFSPSPQIAALATRALALSAGARAMPTLEHILADGRSFEQTLAAIEGIADCRLATTFASLSRLAADESADPILRATAARPLPQLDPKGTKQWLRDLPAAGMNPFLRARFDSVAAELNPKPHGR